MICGLDCGLTFGIPPASQTPPPLPRADELTAMALKDILAELDAEVARLQQAKSLLAASNDLIAEAVKRRWAAQKAKQKVKA